MENRFGFNALKEYEIIWANDILKDACTTYKNNIGNHIVNEDITKIDYTQIPKADIIIGGPPCQGFSGIGKRDPQDKRSELIWSYLDIVKTINPKIFLFENVVGIKSSKTTTGSKVIDDLTKAFNNIGYTLNIFTLNACDYGVPQKRKRVFIVGNKKNIDIPKPPQTHFENEKEVQAWITSYQAISDLNSPTEEGVVSYKSKPENPYQKLMRRVTERCIFTFHTLF